MGAGCGLPVCSEARAPALSGGQGVSQGLPRERGYRSVMDPQRILVVDDEPRITDLVAMALRYEGFEVEIGRSESPEERIHGTILSRAEIRQQKGDYAAAVARYEEVLKINPSDERAHRGIAVLLAACDEDRVRNGKEALKHAEQAFAARVTKAWFNYTTLAVAYAENGQFEKAIESQRKAIELSPQDPELRRTPEAVRRT